MPPPPSCSLAGPFHLGPVLTGEPRILRELAGIGVGQRSEILLFEPAQCPSTPLLKLMPTHLHAGAQTPRKSGQCLDRRILEPISARTRDWAEGEGEPGFLGVDALLD